MRQGRHGVEPGLHGAGRRTCRRMGQGVEPAAAWSGATRHSIPGGLTAARACAKGGHATIADAFFRQPGPPTVPGDQARKNQMKRARIATGVLTATLLATAMPAAAFAMPGDIEEAVTQQGYNAYEYQSSDAAYDDSELLAVEGDYVATANAMIRQSPFGTILGSVQPGATYHVVGECPDCMWCKISGDVSGYVYASYLVPAGEYQQASNSNSDTGANIRSLDMLMTVDVLESSALNLREAPSTDSGVVTSVPAGTEIRVTGNVLNTDWCQCEYDGRTVYAFDDYLKPEFPQTMACNVPALNIREAADTNANVIGTLTMGDKVKVSADENDWLRFEMEDGRIGYVWDEYMEAVGQ